MRKRIICVVLIILALCAAPISARSQTVIWYIPHPDDETIAMADSIYQSVLAGNRNYFVYFTKGENSLARKNIKGPDGQTYNLTKSEFGEARVRETLAALQVLGVEAHQVLFLDFPDGSLPLTAAEEIIRSFASVYPNSTHRTVSKSDPHEDHQTLARALANVSVEKNGTINPEYFHVYIYRNESQANHVQKRQVLYPDIKAEALAQFSYFAPEQGRFAIAATSTPDLIAGALASDYEYLELTDQELKGKSTPSLFLGVAVSNLDLGLFIPFSEQVSILGLYDFKTNSALAELSLNLPDDIPFIQLSLGVGYHFAYNQAYLGAKANLGPYFVNLRHVPRKETRFGFGLMTVVHRPR